MYTLTSTIFCFFLLKSAAAVADRRTDKKVLKRWTNT